MGKTAPHRKTTSHKAIYAHGTIGGALLLAIYLAVVGLIQGFQHAISQFVSLWYLMAPLIIGFGLQISLFSYARSAMHASAAGMGASGGVSAGSMVACCAHHISDVLPAIGVAGISVFLTSYQAFFIVAGILSNIIGMTFMLALLQKHSLYPKNCPLLGRLSGYDMARLRNWAAALSIVMLAAVFIATPAFSASAPAAVDKTFNALTDTLDGVTFEVKPEVSYANAEFYVTMTTHSGSLDYDLAKSSILRDSSGKEYYPARWEGSPPGGHHRSGKLVFGQIDNDASYMSLAIDYDEDGTPDMAFRWDIA